MDFQNISMRPCYRVDLRPRGKSLTDNKPLYFSNLIWTEENVMPNFPMNFSKMHDDYLKFADLF